MSEKKKKDVTEVTLFGQTEEITLPITAKKLTEKFPDYLFFTDESNLEFTAMKPSTGEACKINVSGELMYYMSTTDPMITSSSLGSVTTVSSIGGTTTTWPSDGTLDTSAWTTWPSVSPSISDYGYVSSGHMTVDPSYTESIMPHLVRAKEEGTRKKIEMDTIVLDRGVAVSQGLDHADMILGLKVKYAKEGALPMDSAFVLLKDEKAAAREKERSCVLEEKIRELQKEVKVLEGTLDLKAKMCYDLEEDLKKARKEIKGLRGIALKRGEVLAGDDDDAGEAMLDTEPAVLKISRGGELMKIALPKADCTRSVPVLRAVSADMMKPREELADKYCEVTLNDHKVNIMLCDVLDISQNYSADGWESMEVTLFDGWSTDKILIHDRRDAEALLGAVVA